MAGRCFSLQVLLRKVCCFVWVNTGGFEFCLVWIISVVVNKGKQIV